MESADPEAQKQVGDNKVMDLLKELEGVRKDRENDPGQANAEGGTQTEKVVAMGEPGTTSPVGSK